MFIELAEVEGADIKNFFFGYLGIACALVFASTSNIQQIDIGSAIGTAKSGVGITIVGIRRPDLIIKSVVPVIMAGILGIYGLIIGVVINQKIGNKDIDKYPPKEAFAHLAAGLCNGFSSMVRKALISRLQDYPLE